MKKVKLVGALLAVVMASAPITGYTGDVLSFSDNAIVAEAASSRPSVIMVEPGNCHMDIFGYELNGSAIMQNGDWVLKGDKNGDFYTYNTRTKQKKVLFKSPYNSNSKYPGTNEKISKFKVYFQSDGNIVIYSTTNPKVIRPLCHTSTYSNLTCEKGDCCYYYFLESDGRLVAKRIYKNGKSDDIFDSARCKFVRLV
ncbi:hypothetical protein [Ruminococcus flavefaciens]|uniref:hypothetical protein n=1 Tax=Ruminococcus flavefaciens TaxID=1265 RepID=UPI000491A4EB|nr:hypothetical protein [Ruminococcus flavefaciens]